MYKLKKMLRGKAAKTLFRVGAIALLLGGGLWIGKMEAKAATSSITWEDGKTVFIPKGESLKIILNSRVALYIDDALDFEGTPSAFSAKNLENPSNWKEGVKRVEMKSVLLSDGTTGSGIYCYSSISAKDSPVEKGNKKREKTPQEKWRESEHNPFNYLSEIENADGTITYSAVPTTVNSNVEGVDFIVGQTLNEAEASFEKSDSKYQICVTIEESLCGEQMRKSMEDQAQSLGKEVVGIYDIKTTEREKATYKAVREITSVSGKVTYIFELQDKLKKAVENQKAIQVIQHSEEGGFQVMDSIKIENGSLSLQTSYPSGIFTFIAEK